ncbi:MAG: DUF3305 domain-containing protein [Undibacterium sp.]|uniref:DUF3305 domain-containing protein n=1 Tax=Undibacterium sp. TaxID=1914977 RepID=UPI0027252719|nr:DUF3305 domain-containing protein [Undibacterium sp.]MDO8652808.1 DUF3305 domain-containing protein [Undibacterium sp.]
MDKSTSLPFSVSIVMQRVMLHNRWQSFQWKLLEVLPESSGVSVATVRALLMHEHDARWLFSGFSVDLFVDETPGYFLNLSADTPCWFVMWRFDEVDGLELAIPKSITLSYNEAARWMDAGEQVDTLELSEEVAAWLATYTQEYFQPESKKKRKRPSFEGGEGVDKMARAEWDRS